MIERGDNKAAALSAISLARDYFGKLAFSIAMGWLKRAERLLEGHEDSREYGWLLVVKAIGGMEHHEPDAPIRLSERILKLGMDHGDRDLQGFGLLFQGRTKVAQGKVEEGLALLDEATVAAVSGELGPLATGVIYCVAITSTATLRDYRRAGEWTEAAKRWCERQSISGFPGICRVHRAQILHLRGNWKEAEDDVRLAISELKDFNYLVAGEGFYELGEIRLRMGDLKGAEEAFRQAADLGHDPQPGQALLKLAEGKVQAAANLIRRTLADDSREPLYKFPLLTAQVEIAIAAGDFETAQKASKELKLFAEMFNTPALMAGWLYAAGALDVAQGDPEEASDKLRRAFRLWRQADVPYEAARSCVLLAEAYRKLNDEESAELELQNAASTFARLGADLDLQEVHRKLGHSRSDSPAPARIVRTFMFTDIVKSTKLVEALGDEAWGNMLDWHNRTLRGLFLAHTGEEVKQVGDGFFVAFERPVGALDCAVAIQKSLDEHRRMHGFSPEVRIGLNCGEASKRGVDYEGKEVHQASRIGSLAGPGEILAARSVFDDTDGRFKAGEFRSVSLKGIAEPVDVVAIDWR